MKKPKVIIVDENDNPIGLKYREDIDYSKDTYRCTGIWITNSNDEVLIAQRKFTKDKDPGKWGPAVAGTIEEGETYESNAYKEMKEEIWYMVQDNTQFFQKSLLCNGFIANWTNQ